MRWLMVAIMKAKDISGTRFGRLVAKYPTDKRINGRVVWHCQCDCGKSIDAPISYLTSGETLSCGCLKGYLEGYQLRDAYEAKRINGVAIQLFKGQEPRKDSSTGYRGVSRYLTRKSKEERYRAWITVGGKRYYKSGFLTASDAYYRGRLALEEKHLPPELRQNK